MNERLVRLHCDVSWVDGTMSGLCEGRGQRSQVNLEKVNL